MSVLVAKGVGIHQRRSYRFWEEKLVPRTFFDIASKKTYKQDLGIKRDLYETLRIAEYFVFDPEGVYVRLRFQGFRLVRGIYAALIPDAVGALISKELGLRMVPEGAMLRLIDLGTGEPVLTPSERADHRQRRADALEAE